jgi:hypothetical protein
MVRLVVPSVHGMVGMFSPKSAVAYDLFWNEVFPAAVPGISFVDLRHDKYNIVTC